MSSARPSTIALLTLALHGCAATVSLGYVDAGPSTSPDLGAPVDLDATDPRDANPSPADAALADAPPTTDRPASADRVVPVDVEPTPDRWAPRDVPVVLDPDCVMTGVERCNGLDDDCDGTVDVLAPTPCAYNACATGMLTCRSGIAAGAAEDALCEFLGYLPAGTVCRRALHACDVTEVCTGASVHCPEDEGAHFTHVCRPARSACDRENTCTGGPRGGCRAISSGRAGTSCGSNLVCDIFGQCSPCEVDEIFCGGRCHAALPCAVGVGACQVQGYLRCHPGGVMECPVRALPPTPERCDGVDNDCDGITDEGLCRIGSRCVPDGYVNPNNPCEVCIAPATAPAVMGWSAVPAGTVCRPARDRCDVAERCAGATCPPDGLAPAGTVCRPSSGRCDPAETCDGASAACPDGAATLERCDEIDNDCDGLVDEGFCRIGGRCFAHEALNPDNACQQCVAPDGVAAPTAWSHRAAGVVCRASRVDTACDPEERCAGDGSPCPANAVTRRPTPEVCDGVDNDCDGTTDEELTRRCYDGPPATQDIGTCRSGVQRCVRGAWGACEGQTVPRQEICDDADDDCDSLLDNRCFGS